MSCPCGEGVASVVVRIAALAGIGLTVGMIHSSRVRLVAPPARDAAPATRTEPGAAPAPQSSAAPTPGPSDPGADAPLAFHITLEQAKRLFEEGVPFIDARPDHEHAQGTIPGSHHITPGSFSTPETGRLLVFIDPDKTLVIFCSGGDCHDSENLAALMQDAGYKAVHIFTDGFPAWEKAGYEVDRPGPAGPEGKGT